MATAGVTAAAGAAVGTGAIVGSAIATEVGVVATGAIAEVVAGTAVDTAELASTHVNNRLH